MTALWGLLGFGIVGVLLALRNSFQRRRRPVELGSVSHQWINERRMAQTQDPQR